jgi:hypothetical protein
MRGVRILLFFEKHLFWGPFNIIVIIQSLGIRCDGSKWQEMAAGDEGGVWRGSGCANSAVDYNKQ